MSLALDPVPPAARRPRPPAPIPLDKPPGTLALLKGLRDNPVATWTRWHFERPIVHGSSVLGRAAVVSDPAVIRHVLVDNAANYDKGGLQRRVLGGGLGTGLLLAEGAQWKAQRRALAPLFSPRHVANFKLSMVTVADELVARWSPLRPGRRIDVAAEMARVTLRVLARTVFSEAMDGPEDRFAKVASKFFEAVGKLDPLDVLDMPSWVPRLASAQTKPLVRYFEDEVSAMLAKRRALMADDPAAAPHDLLTLLLGARDPETGDGLSDDDVKANLVTFLIAGHETTSNTLTWALYLLSEHPDALRAVEREVDEQMPDGRVDPEYVDRFVHTRAAIEEAMRLYPPAASITREALGPDTLGTVRIKARTMVIVSPYVLHRHKTLWDEPDHFIPERFLPENRGGIDRFAFLPFGAGPRVCIAASFALQEAVIVLATVLRHFRLTLSPGHDVMPVQRITLRSRGGMPHDPPAPLTAGTDARPGRRFHPRGARVAAAADRDGSGRAGGRRDAAGAGRGWGCARSTRTCRGSSPASAAAVPCRPSVGSCSKACCQTRSGPGWGTSACLQTCCPSRGGGSDSSSSPASRPSACAARRSAFATSCSSRPSPTSSTHWRSGSASSIPG